MEDAVGIIVTPALLASETLKPYCDMARRTKRRLFVFPLGFLGGDCPFPTSYLGEGGVVLPQGLSFTEAVARGLTTYLLPPFCSDEDALLSLRLTAVSRRDISEEEIDAAIAKCTLFVTDCVREWRGLERREVASQRERLLRAVSPIRF